VPSKFRRHVPGLLNRLDMLNLAVESRRALPSIQVMRKIRRSTWVLRNAERNSNPARRKSRSQAIKS